VSGELGAARPDLTAPLVCKPDILVRLAGHLTRKRVARAALLVDLADAIDVIAGLRASDARRLAMINDYKRALLEARAGPAP